jgi:hypothetical protein
VTTASSRCPSIQGDTFSEVVVDPVTGEMRNAEAITGGGDLTAATS